MRHSFLKNKRWTQFAAAPLLLLVVGAYNILHGDSRAVSANEKSDTSKEVSVSHSSGEASGSCSFSPIEKPNKNQLTEYTTIRSQIEIKRGTIGDDRLELINQIHDYAQGTLSIARTDSDSFVESIMNLAQHKIESAAALKNAIRAFVVHGAAFQYAADATQGLGLNSSEARKFADDIYLRKDPEGALAAHEAAFKFAKDSRDGLGLEKTADAIAFANRILLRSEPAERIAAFRHAFHFARTETGYSMSPEGARKFAAEKTCVN